jgi:glycosyltransferase involved in cell wall biosynthesis
MVFSQLFSMKLKSKIKLFSVFNTCSETNIPLENFIQVDPSKFEKHVLSFRQTTKEMENFISRAYGDQKLKMYGLHRKNIYFPLGLLKLMTIFLREKPDIIHIHHSFSGLVAGFLGMLFTGARIISTVHSNYNFYNHRQKIMFLLIYMMSDLIVCNSRNTGKSIEKLRRRFFPSGKIQVIYNGVNLRLIGSRRASGGRCGAARDKFSIGTVGRLVPAKDHATLIRAFVDFNKTVPDSALTLVGDGPLRKPLEQLANDLNAADKVIFCGSLSREHAYEALCSFDLFVVSSRWEGFCNAMVEAQLAQVPVLASGIAPLPEVLGPDNGVFFSPGDPGDLYRKMMFCYLRRERMETRSRLAYNFARDRYSLTLSARRYEQVYLSVLALRDSVSINRN